MKKKNRIPHSLQVLIGYLHTRFAHNKDRRMYVYNPQQPKGQTLFCPNMSSERTSVLLSTHVVPDTIHSHRKLPKGGTLAYVIVPAFCHDGINLIRTSIWSWQPSIVL